MTIHKSLNWAFFQMYDLCELLHPSWLKQYGGRSKQAAILQVKYSVFHKNGPFPIL